MRKRFSDKQKVGPSNIVPFIPGEDPGVRHERRKKVALNTEESFKSWCQNNRIDLKVSNEGHHWRFLFNTKLIEWWPATAKLVIQRKYRNGIHVHDCEQVKRILKTEFLKSQNE